MAEIDFLDTHPAVRRDYDRRAAEKTPDVVRIAKQFGPEFFDGERRYGYGGFRYDGRWKAVVRRMQEHYGLPGDAAILDVGCAKGFMMHDFKERLPRCAVAGVDVSAYALAHGMPDIKPYMVRASAERLPFPDRHFDLVVSVNSIHNLPLEKLKTALGEVVRVCRGHSYITVDAWRNRREQENLHKWVLTAETMMHVDDWHRLFDEVGYRGDCWWFIAE